MTPAGTQIDLKSPAPASPAPPHPPRPLWKTWTTFALGVLLIAGAIAMLTRNADALRPALASLRGSPAWYLPLLLVLPLINIASVSAGFWVLTEPHARRGVYGRLTPIETIALITSGWLLNSLPLRPGLLGRVAYHAVVNRVPVAISVLVLLRVMGCAAAALAIMLATLWLAQRATLSAAGVLTALAASVLGTLALSVLIKRLLPASDGWRYLACIACRLVDINVWTLRYLVIFSALGRSLSPLHAGVIAASSEAAMLSPVQIGLREWVVGLTSSWLSGNVSTIDPHQASVGILADVINRAIEVGLGLPLGLLAGAWLAKRALGARTAAPPLNQSP